MKKYQIAVFVVYFLNLFTAEMFGQEEDIIGEINLSLLVSDYNKVLILCDSAIKNQHISPEIFYKQSIAYRSVYHYKKALVSIKHALGLDPDNINIQIEFGKVCYTLNMFNKADSVFSMIFESDTTNYISGIYLTRIHLKKEEFDKAFIIFNRLSQMDSTNNYLFRQMGICKIKNKEANEAIPYFKQAIALDSMDIKSYEYLAKVYQAIDEDDTALNVLGKAIKINPTNADLYVRIGNYTLCKKSSL
jgi:tetratricopeptide (TPR) repeat protein